MIGTFWTPEEVAILDEMYLDGCTPSEIAAELPNRSLDAVKCKMWWTGRRRTPGRVPNHDLRLTILECLKKRMSISEISRMLGRRDPAPIWKIVKKLEQAGLVKRVGGRDLRRVRYVPTKLWTNGDREAST